MKRIIYLLSLLVCVPCFPQTEKNFRHIFQEAEYYLNSEQDYESAVPLYLMLNEMEPDNYHIKYKIGICYLNIPGNKNRAIAFLEEASKKTTPYFSYNYKEISAPLDALFYLGKGYHLNNQLEKAIGIYKEFMKGLQAENYQDIEFIGQQIHACEIARILQGDPENYPMIKLDDEINAYQINFSPAISGDGQDFIYTAKMGTAHRIFYCKREEGDWSKPVDITNQLGTNEVGISCCLSFDGQKLYLFLDDQGMANLYESKKTNGLWSKAEKLNRNINSKYWESRCCISVDGSTLYFSSNRKGGFGGLDIYKSELDEKGDWGPAINLGPSINTPMMEDSPMITGDNTTLYFSSQGHYNMGGYDLFYSVLGKNRKWSIPVNLGFPINSTDDDLYFTPIGKGDSAYYVQFTYSGLPTQDIYLVNLKTEEKVLSDIIVTGSISLQDRIFEMDSSFYVHIVDVVSNDTLRKVQVDPKSGDYSVAVPPGEYKMVIKGEGYEPVEKDIILSKGYVLPDLSVNAELVPGEIINGDYLAIQNILFGFDDFSLTSEAKINLEKMVSVMNEHPSLEYEIIGHTDVVGNSDYNLQLSRRRANSVFQYLVERGISKSRVQTKGVGEIVAVARNEWVNGTEGRDGRKMDRRVEIKIRNSDPDVTLTTESYLPDHLKKAGDLNYTVIVMKVKKRLPDNFFNSYDMEDLKYIREEEAEDGFLYTLGVFSQRTKAVSMVGKLYNVGLTEAWIVDQHELSDLVVSDNGPKKSMFGNPEAINGIPIYTIQVCALKNAPHPGAFENLKDLRITLCEDGFTRYTVGEYPGYRAAKEALIQIQKTGYDQAWVRPVAELK